MTSRTTAAAGVRGEPAAAGSGDCLGQGLLGGGLDRRRDVRDDVAAGDRGRRRQPVDDDAARVDRDRRGAVRSAQDPVVLRLQPVPPDGLVRGDRTVAAGHVGGAGPVDVAQQVGGVDAVRRGIGAARLGHDAHTRVVLRLLQQAQGPRGVDVLGERDRLVCGPVEAGRRWGRAG